MQALCRVPVAPAHLEDGSQRSRFAAGVRRERLRYPAAMHRLKGLRGWWEVLPVMAGSSKMSRLVSRFYSRRFLFHQPQGAVSAALANLKNSSGLKRQLTRYAEHL